MTDDPTTGADAPDENPAPADGSADAVKTPIGDLPADTQDYIRELRQEAKANREALAEHKRQQDTAADAAKRKEAEDQGRYKDIIADLEPKAQAAADMQAEWDTYFTARMEALLEQVPDDKRDLIPEAPIKTQVAWIEMAIQRGVFGEARRPAPKTDAGVTGDRRENVKLTAEEHDIARAFGTSPEDYAKFKTEK